MRPFKRIALLSALAAVIVAGVRYGSTVSRLAEVDREMADRQPRLEGLAPVISQIEIFRMKKATQEMKRALVASLRANAFPERLLDRLWDTSPATLSLERIVVDDRGVGRVIIETPEGSRSARRGARIEISGRADEAGSVAGWGQRLEELGLLERFEVASDRASDGDGADAVEFTLTGRLVPSRSERSGDDTDVREAGRKPRS